MFDPSFCHHCNVNKLDPKDKYFLPNGIAVCKECAERHGSDMAKRNAGRRATTSTRHCSTASKPWRKNQGAVKPSTVNGYKSLFRTYLKPHAGKALRDFRCMDATNVLTAIHRERDLSRKSLRHVKGLLSTIFMHAKRGGVIDGLNPIKDAGIPRAAAKAEPIHPCTADEILALLNVLPTIARIAVALQYFCGLRPREARAVRWEDYDADKGILRVSRSMWRTHLDDPKTEQSVAPGASCAGTRRHPRQVAADERIHLAGPSGKPVDLHNLAARVVVPALERCAVCHEMKSKHANVTHEFKLDERWRGWYACRRGCATLATSLDSALTAKSLLRHANIATTQSHYIKSVPAEAVRAVDKINALFDNANSSDRPN